ncbi:prolipoprotein diacylglyceryl transferase [Urechidicola croceus]|uniref:Phosphatidylglycerol--prolipoprotein diacylglyceryl transferase n=1 Tax=Urechidicola croceus TaxID=1850246 RepID=A0A1D8P5W1_9FLAO|nr:prolipoprotein diacylglyceryl transferase [Urechidicola croceus]AOW19956.1 prolipoprotein diacylglyceryl transferase [Urechidicola croceus]
MLQLAIDWNPSPEIFKLGPLSIRYYGLMFVIAFLLGIQIMKKIYKNENVPVQYVDSLFIYVVIATLLGARLGEVFFYSWDSYKDNLIEILLPIAKDPNGSIFGIINGYKFVGFAGLASHGAAIGIIVAMYLYRRKYKYKSLLWILDRIVIPVASGAVFVRLGNLMNSEIVGKVTNSNFGFRFIRNDIGKGEAMRITKTDNFEKAYSLIGKSSNYQNVLEAVPVRYPTQLFESLSYIVVFSILWFVYWKTDKKDKSGYLFGLFMVLLWSVRFIIEFFKVAQIDERTDWTLNTGQLLSIPMILIGLFFMFRKVKTA